jgi:hypothetical protein
MGTAQRLWTVPSCAPALHPVMELGLLHRADSKSTVIGTVLTDTSCCFTQRPESYASQAKSHPPPILIKFYWNTAMPICFHTLWPATRAKLSPCDRDHITFKVWRISSLAFYKGFLTSILDDRLFCTSWTVTFMNINRCGMIFKKCFVTNADPFMDAYICVQEGERVYVIIHTQNLVCLLHRTHLRKLNWQNSGEQNSKVWPTMPDVSWEGD